jgi:hypothetical protein
LSAFQPYNNWGSGEQESTFTMITARKLLLVALLSACATAQQMGAWNMQSPPSCVGLNVTLTYTKNFGQSDYDFTIDWGDSSITSENRTVQDGETVSYDHVYAASGSFQLVAKALVVSFQTEVSES